MALELAVKIHTDKRSLKKVTDTWKVKLRDKPEYYSGEQYMSNGASFQIPTAARKEERFMKEFLVIVRDGFQKMFPTLTDLELHLYQDQIHFQEPAGYLENDIWNIFIGGIIDSFGNRVGVLRKEPTTPSV